MVETRNYDLVIIGSGAAGFSAATQAKNLGVARVALIERGTMWGTCVNYGCVPSKFLITVAEMVHARNNHHPGVRIDAGLDLRAVLAEKQAIIARSWEKKQKSLVGTLGVEIIRGEASFLSPHEIRVGEVILTAPRFIIAAGSSPSIPPVRGIESVRPMTSTEALSPEKIPPRLIVLGGRALGLEFAELYAHLGSKVTLLQRSPTIIPEEEMVIARVMTRYLRDEGIEIRTSVDLEGVERVGGEVIVSARIDGHPEQFRGDEILLATGRTPNTRDLQLEKAGVNVDRAGAVIVDQYLRTTAPHIWAAGDVLGEPQLEVAAKAGGVIAAENAIAGKNRIFDKALLPHVIFTTPQVAVIGVTEAAARHAGLRTVTRCTPMDALVKSSIIGDTRGIVKIVAEEGTERILGVHICAPLASEMIQEAVIAVRHRLTVDDLIGTFHVFPTLTEILWVCARSFRHKGAGDCGDGK